MGQSECRRGNELGAFDRITILAGNRDKRWFYQGCRFLFPNFARKMAFIIHYPDKKPSIKSVDGKELIFCTVRKRWMLLTPEEWVRQNFLLYLVHVEQYPVSLIGVEKQFDLHDVKKRFDIVVYDLNGAPFMIVECKEMNQPLNENVLGQILRYNLKLRAKVVVLTNGNGCAAFELRDSGMEPIQQLPSFPARND